LFLFILAIVLSVLPVNAFDQPILTQQYINPSRIFNEHGVPILCV